MSSVSVSVVTKKIKGIRTKAMNSASPSNRIGLVGTVVQVNEVQPGQVVVTDAPTNTKKNVEFGTCIWTTGIKMHPLVDKLAKTLPQGLHHTLPMDLI